MKEIHVTKKQHFVPREYLRPWCFADEKIWCSYNKAEPFESNLMGVGNQNYFYKFNPDFSTYEAKLARALFENRPNPETYSFWVDRYEQAAEAIKKASADSKKKKICEDFEKQIEEEINCKLENNFYPILHRLQQGNTSFYNTNPTSEDDENAGITAAFLYGLMEVNLRTKNMKNSIVGNIVEGAAQRNINPNNLWMLTRHQFATYLGYILFVNHFNLFILEDETNSLITGDQPVFNSNPEYVNGEATQLEYYCPLTPNKALLLTLNNHVEKKMTIEKRDLYNKLVRDSSETQIYSNSKEVLKYVLELK